MTDQVATDAEIAELARVLSGCCGSDCTRQVTHLALNPGRWGIFGHCDEHAARPAGPRLRIRPKPRKKATMDDIRAAGVAAICMDGVTTSSPVLLYQPDADEHESKGHDVRWITSD